MFFIKNIFTRRNYFYECGQEKKNLFFSFTEGPLCGHRHPKLHLGTLMDIRGLAERTES
jgi:hypothetical protein